jgi:hypothetical protein
MYESGSILQVESLYREHRKLYNLFESEYAKNKVKDFNKGVKFYNLPILCLENFLYIYQDLVFIVAQFQLNNSNSK